MSENALIADEFHCPNPVANWVGVMNEALQDGATGAFYWRMTIDASGNTYSVGSLGGTSDLDPTEGVDIQSGPSPSDLFVTRINADGTYAWSRVVGSDSNRAGIAIAPDGSVLVAADFEGIVDFDPGPGEDIRSATGFHESFLWRLSPDGDYLGTIVFGTSAPQTHGSYARAVDVDDSGNVYVTGRFIGTVDFNPGESEDLHSFSGAGSYVTKFGADGSYLWTRSFGSNQSNGGQAIAVAPNGDVLASGHFRGSVDFDPGPGQDIHVATIPGATYLTKLTADGDQVWTRSWQILASNGTPFAIDSVGDIWMTGSYSNIFNNPVIDFDPTEGEDWQPAPSGSRILVTRVTGDGNYGGTWLFSSSDSTRANDIAITPDGLIVLAGYFTGMADFDPGPGSIERTSQGNLDAFVAAYDPGGTPIWVRVQGNASFDSANGVALRPTNELYVFGVFRGELDLDPGCAVEPRGVPGGIHAQTFIITLGCVEPYADADGNGVVDLRDAAAFFNCFSDAGSPESPAVCPQGCYAFDFDHDDDIDLDDLAVFLDHLSTP